MTSSMYNEKHGVWNVKAHLGTTWEREREHKMESGYGASTTAWIGKAYFGHFYGASTMSLDLKETCL